MNFIILLSVLAIISGLAYGQPQNTSPEIIEFRQLIEGTSCAADIFSDINEETDFTGNTLLQAEIMYPDSVLRHFYFVIPPGYDPEESNPLFIWLHGGVSTPDLRTMDPVGFSEWHLIPRLLEEGYLVAFPCAQLNAVWWDSVGEEGILSIVEWMKATFRIDDSKVFIGGFSDGASGCFSLMMLNPDYFAGYLAFSGHIGVAAIAGDRGTYLPSLFNRPGIVTHSDDDGLYPASGMAPLIALAKDAGARIEYSIFEGFTHDPSYLPLIEDRVIEFMDETERERFPEHIIWETSEPSGCDWLKIDSIVAWPLIGIDSDDFNTLLVSDRLQFGFYPDRDFEGPGVLITGVADGDLPAVRLGFSEGDIIAGFMNEDVANMQDIAQLQTTMFAGDSFSIDILRNGEILHMQNWFNPPEYYWLLPRTGPSVKVEAVYDNNQFEITVNRFCEIRLLLHPEMIDFTREIIVKCNGLTVFQGKVEEDGNFAMTHLMTNLDLERSYTAELKLSLEELMAPLMYQSN